MCVCVCVCVLRLIYDAVVIQFIYHCCFFVAIGCRQTKNWKIQYLAVYNCFLTIHTGFEIIPFCKSDFHCMQYKYFYDGF